MCSIIFKKNLYWPRFPWRIRIELCITRVPHQGWLVLWGVVKLSEACWMGFSDLTLMIFPLDIQKLSSLSKDHFSANVKSYHFTPRNLGVAGNVFLFICLIIIIWCLAQQLWPHCDGFYSTLPGDTDFFQQEQQLLQPSPRVIGNINTCWHKANKN